MKLKRLVRDTCVLIAFCGAFYLLTVFVSRLDASGLDDGSDFSVARQQADEFWTNRDYASAADEYKKLTEADPFNGHAWHTRALCYYNMRSATLDEIRTEQFELARAEAGKRGLSSVGQLYAKPDFEFTDSPRVLELKAKIKSLNEKARPIFLRAKEFARFRGNAALYLAVIESYEGNNEKALDLLEEYVSLACLRRVTVSIGIQRLVLVVTQPLITKNRRVLGCIASLVFGISWPGRVSISSALVARFE